MKVFDWKGGRLGAILLFAVAVALVVMLFESHRPPGRMPKIGAGYCNLVVLKSDGSLWSMGLNYYGVSVGDGTTNDRPRLVRIGNDNDWADVASGNLFSLALKTDGSLWAWGFNRMGQLGDGTRTNRNHPVRVGQDHDWITIALAASGTHSLAQKADGSVWEWGQKAGAGQAQTVPTQVGADKEWRFIATMGGDSCRFGIKSDGSLWMWGGSRRAVVLGDGTVQENSIPVQIGTANDWVTISGGDEFAVGLRADGSLWAWGENSAGQFGDGTKVRSLAPKQIGNSTDWKMVAAGFQHTLALKSDGSLWAWGDNRSGQAGNGTNEYALSPVRIGASKDWVWVGAGGRYSVALKRDGSLWMWGYKIGGKNKLMVWLRETITKYKIPLKLAPPPPDLVPVKIDHLGPLPTALQPR